MKIENIPFFHEYDESSRRLVLRGADHIPDEIYSFADQIEFLDASQGQLEELPDDFCRLSRLKTAFFSLNQFREFPKVLRHCRDLDIVGFKSCKIEHVPEGALPQSLRWLILTDNRIARLPDDIGSLALLQKLALAGNQLTSVPESLCCCRSLELLRLGANRIQHTLPSALYDLSRLAWFCDSGNMYSVEQVSQRSPTLMRREELLLGERIGGSPTSQVFQGTILSTGERVAVKEYRGHLTSDGYAVDDMRASIAVGTHASLVQVIGRIDAEGERGESLVLRLIPPEFRSLGLPPSFASCTRDTFPAETRLSPRFVLQVLRDISQAVEHLHQRGLTHGDLYAHNILSDPEGHSILGDFGAASFFDGADVRRCQIEVRAFGCLIEDLLSLVAIQDRGETFLRLESIRQRCQHATVAERPLAAEVAELLAAV